jgi:DNA-directed RNA polymerase II subunit RPB2
MISEDNIWNILEEYVNTKGIVQHQIDSYNYVINEYFQRIFDEVPDIVLPTSKKNEKYVVSFGQVYIDYPKIVDENRNTVLLTPYECRLRDLTYDSQITVDIRESWINTETEETITENLHPKTFISRVPAMIGSCRCNLEKYTKEEKVKAGECENDPGGYFIIRGKERTLICQERINYNHVYVFEQKQNSKSPYIAEIRSMSDETGHSVKIEAKMSSDGRSVVFQIPYIKDEIPARILFKALNFSDEDILSLIDLSEVDNQKVQDILYSIMNTNKKIKTRNDALSFIGQNPHHVVSDDKKFSYAEQVVDNELFPHIGNSTEKERGLLLGYMLKLLVLTYTGLRTEDDRDNLSLKRVEGPGTLIGDLFRMLLKRLIESAKKYLLKRQDILIVLSRVSSVNNGLRHSFATGNWGVQKNNYIRTGVSQVLSRLTYSASISHLRRVVIPIGKEGKNTKIRQLHPTQIFFIDPAESPEGQSIGIVKNLALMAKLSTGIPTVVVREVVETSKNLYKINEIEISELDQSMCKVFINGVLIGFTDNQVQFIKDCKYMRKIGLLHHEISISYDETDNDVKILSDDGRLIRPVFVVENGELLIKPEHASYGWDRLVEEGYIQYVDNSEVENNLIAMFPKDLTEYEEHKMKYSYCEIHPCLMLGVCAGAIPLSDHNQSPRNCYQTSMMKQAMGIFCSNYRDRVDTVVHVLHQPQKPLVSTKINKMLKYDDMPSGINAIVAVACYTGFNQEDSVILNKNAIDRGLFVSSCFKTLVCEERKKSSNNYETIEIPPSNIRMKNTNYSKLGPDGIVRKGTPVFKGDVIIGKTSTKSYKDDDESKTDCSYIIKNGEEGVIDMVYSGLSSEGNRLIKIKIRSLRIPEVGDKVASRSAQKGTIGMVLNQEDMPFTDEGIVPDIILNPQALPSRMTLAQLIECVQGKRCAMMGEYADATPFTDASNDPVENIAKGLSKCGFERYGYEQMYNGMTGEPLKAKIFIGPTYYQRLKHLVADKIHSRSLGNVTMLSRQPAEGRSRDGGLRLGEMERDSLITHGTASFIKERLFDMSDPYQVIVCRKCGGFCSSVDECRGCNDDNIVKVQIPYACKLLLQELNAMGIKTQISVKE